MKNLIIAASVASLSLALAGTLAFAQQGMGQGRNGPPENTPFESIDADGNGTLSRTEVKDWAEGVFGAMDSDDNGKLTQEEYMAVRMGPGAADGGNVKRQAQMQADKAARFAVMDKDHDGMVSNAEFMAGSQARFDAAGGGNGEITRQQWMKSK
jgi:Ca2+-binding EF-hand superfamily protein